MSSDTVFVTCPNCQAKQAVPTNQPITLCKFCSTEIPHEFTKAPAETIQEDSKPIQEKYNHDVNLHAKTDGEIHDILTIARSEVQLSRLVDSSRPSIWSYDRISPTDQNYGEVLIAKSLIKLTESEDELNNRLAVAYSYLNQGLAFGIPHKQTNDYLLTSIVNYITLIFKHHDKEIGEYVEDFEKKYSPIENAPENIKRDFEQLTKKEAQSFEAICDPILDIYELIWSKLQTIEVALAVNYWRELCNQYYFSLPINRKVKINHSNRLNDFFEQITSIFPNLEKTQNKNNDGKEKVGCCCIFAATVPSNNNQYLSTFRKYRDSKLRMSRYGTQIIDLYYHLSNIFVPFIEDSSIMRKLFLDICVKPAYLFAKFSVRVL